MSDDFGIDRNDVDIIKAQLIRRIHGVRSINSFPNVVQADMALTQAGDVIDIVLATAAPLLLAAERERIAQAIDSVYHWDETDEYEDALCRAASIARNSP